MRHAACGTDTQRCAHAHCTARALHGHSACTACAGSPLRSTPSGRPPQRTACAQVFSEATRGWDAQQNAAYGAAVGVATTCCGLLTGLSVRRLGNRLHTVVWTLATAVSTLLFTSPSTRVAMASVPFGAAEDTMQAAATARLVQAGAAQGMRRGQLAADYGNLVAVVRVFGLYFFGKLCSVGMSTGMPQLPYVICAALQLVAVALVFTLPAASWRNDPEGDAGADAGD